MHHAVGVSALVGLLAVLAFGTLYGILGVLIAIPMTAVIQVLLDTMVVNAEPVAEPAGLVGSPWEDLRARVRALRQQARVRLRARTSRMGIDPATADHVVDAVDQQIEVAVARVEQLISVAAADFAAVGCRGTGRNRRTGCRARRSKSSRPSSVSTRSSAPPRMRSERAAPRRSPALAELREATGQVGQAVGRSKPFIAATAGSQGPLQNGLERGRDASTTWIRPRSGSRRRCTTSKPSSSPRRRNRKEDMPRRNIRHVRTEMEQAIRPKRD